MTRPCLLVTLIAALLTSPARAAEHDLQRLPYNHPGLTVDLKVGLWAWPLPMDWDADGDLDLVVSCPDVPSNGIYFFENPSGEAPVFRPGKLVGRGVANISLSHVDGAPRVLTPGKEYVDFLGGRFEKQVAHPPGKMKVGNGRTRADQRKLVDYNHDGLVDMVIGVGYWGDYGWDNAYNDQGEWTNGPLHGYVLVALNRGTNDTPEYDEPVKLRAGGAEIDVYGMPSPCLADFDADGDLDLLCGEFVDGFTYFENTGSRAEPVYAAGRPLARNGEPLRMELCMIVPTAIDWDADGDVDLVVGQEDGRVALVEHTGQVADGVPVFKPPVFFRQQAEDLNYGALVTPVSCDWDNDGDPDLIAGNSAGFIGFIENLGRPAGQATPTWAEPVHLRADGRVLRVQAGENGSIQGPCESKWGYTTQTVADLNGDGLLDIVYNSIWGKIEWLPNVGEPGKPVLAGPRPVKVDWQGPAPKPEWNWWDPAEDELVTQWRTTPIAIDWDRDNTIDLVMLDPEGYLTLYRGVPDQTDFRVAPGERLFHTAAADSQPPQSAGLLRLTEGRAGRSGRRKLCLVDWDADGDLDLLANGPSVELLENTGGPDNAVFASGKRLAERRLAGHTTSPTTVDWNRDRVPELLIGAEDGFLYYAADRD
ncbi:FG-GAP repeat protein [Posidoniimonas polymericola]|uniref:FG-GAP repeat protein n=1 Tax=Posidoniimonas polymericola TaxID=2528002 RepID=A0A5C5YSB9_9BACT|nr:VCBS repeat-containing protein [Posidoniimonas polymericola]TWT77839.1 FG-GAP repeat protein [Posidoniimonas polymericola]